MNCLFQVVEKKTGLVVSVYHVRDDKKGFAHFLVNKDNQWKYMSAKHFAPLLEDYYEKDFV